MCLKRSNCIGIKRASGCLPMNPIELPLVMVLTMMAVDLTPMKILLSFYREITQGYSASLNPNKSMGMRGKIYKIFEYGYIAMALFSVYVVVVNWSENRERSYMFLIFAVVAVGMYFFKRWFRKNMENRSK
jgi:CDP-diglyceride synthetase